SGPTGGLQAWPVALVSGSAGLYRLGPPKNLWGGPTERIGQSQDGRMVVMIVRFEGALLPKLDQQVWGGRILEHDRAVYGDISPDGRWVATGSHGGTGIKVWPVVGEYRLERDLTI